MRPRTTHTATLLLAAAASIAVPTAPTAAQQPGLLGTALLMRQLDGVKRVLMIAAHPDDEDTSLLATLARGMGAETAYLSLSRGEGGQNFIGPRLHEGLGVIRTGELVAARALDGGDTVLHARLRLRLLEEPGRGARVLAARRGAPRRRLRGPQVPPACDRDGVFGDAARRARPASARRSNGARGLHGGGRSGAFSRAGRGRGDPVDTVQAVPLGPLLPRRSDAQHPVRRLRSRCWGGRTSSWPWRAAAVIAPRRWARVRRWGRAEAR